MPKKDINLLPREDFEKQPLGKLLIWSLSIGRWIVVVIELIVILAFLSRFKLDRDLANLHESIRAKQAVIQSSAAFEKDFRLFQNRLTAVDKLANNQLGAVKLLDEVAKVTPEDVVLINFSYSNDEVRMIGNALSEKGLKAFVNGLTLSQTFKGIEVSNVTKRTEGGEGFRFIIAAKTKEVQTKKQSQ